MNSRLLLHNHRSIMHEQLRDRQLNVLIIRIEKTQSVYKHLIISRVYQGIQLENMIDQ
jgi:predicted kinase